MSNNNNNATRRLTNGNNYGNGIPVPTTANTPITPRTPARLRPRPLDIPSKDTPRRFLIFDFGPRGQPLPSPRDFVDQVLDKLRRREGTIAASAPADGERQYFRIPAPGVFGSDAAVLAEAEVRFSVSVQMIIDGITPVSTLVW